MSLIICLFVTMTVFMLTESTQLIPNQKIQTPLQRIISVQIKNGDKKSSFMLNRDATTYELYRKAESLGIIEPTRDTILWEDSGRVIIDDSSMMLLLLLPPSPNPRIPQQAMLSVFNVDQIMLTVHIINGLKTWSFTTHCGMSASEVYHQAIQMGIMDNADQFELQYDNDRILGLYSDPPPILLNAIDPFHPHSLTLYVSPVPEGFLLFAMFRDMTPYQDLPFWKYAQFCRDNQWHELCSSLSGMKEYNRDYNGCPDANKSVITHLDEGTGQWVHHIHVDNVPSLSGQLHLKYVPQTVRSLTVRGMSVSVQINELRQSSLKELEFGFQKVVGINVPALIRLTEAPLEILRLPTSKLWEGAVAKLLEMLTHSRAIGLIQLELIEFSGGKRIYYDSDNKTYLYRSEPSHKR